MAILLGPNSNWPKSREKVVGRFCPVDMGAAGLERSNLNCLPLRKMYCHYPPDGRYAAWPFDLLHCRTEDVAFSPWASTTYSNSCHMPVWCCLGGRFLDGHGRLFQEIPVYRAVAALAGLWPQVEWSGIPMASIYTHCTSRLLRSGRHRSPWKVYGITGGFLFSTTTKYVERMAQLNKDGGAHHGI